MSLELEHTLDDPPVREDLVQLLAEAPPPPLGAGLRAEASQVACELARVWSGGALPAGTRLGPYTLERVLGAGGQGTVYRAQDQAGRAWAVKVPRPELVSRLVREAQILFHLDHPRIVRIEKAVIDAPVPYIATELLEQGSLADLLQRGEGRLAPERALQLADEVLDALDYAHGKGVIHRDLKPSNILFDASGRVKVADFGIGSLSLVEGRRLDGTLCSADRTLFAGTPVYMAPEQEHIEEPLDGRADLYALGKVLYQALTGRSPRTVQPLSRHLPGLDPAWDAFLWRLVEDRPEDRFPSAAAAREALARLRGPSEAAEEAAIQAAIQTAGPSVSASAPAPAVARLELGEPLLPAPGGLSPRSTPAVVAQVAAAVELIRRRGEGGVLAFVGPAWSCRPPFGEPHDEPVEARQLADLVWLGGPVALRGERVCALLPPRTPSPGAVRAQAELGEVAQALELARGELSLRGVLLFDLRGETLVRAGDEAALTAGVALSLAHQLREASGLQELVVRHHEQGLLCRRVGESAFLAVACDARVVKEHLVLAALEPLAGRLGGLLERLPREAARRRQAFELIAEGAVVVLVTSGEVLVGRGARLRGVAPAELEAVLLAALGLDAPARPASRAPVWLALGFALGLGAAATSWPQLAVLALLGSCAGLGALAARRVLPEQRWFDRPGLFALLLLGAVVGAVLFPIAVAVNLPQATPGTVALATLGPSAGMGGLALALWRRRRGVSRAGAGPR